MGKPSRAIPTTAWLGFPIPGRWLQFASGLALLRRTRKN